MMHLPNQEALQRQCAAFNARCAVGDRVAVRMDSGCTTITTTRTPAQVLSGHTAVVWLNGIAGCYDLDRVSPITAERGAAA